MSACNNACWALGELAVKSAPEDLGPYALAVVERLVPILSAPVGSMPRSIIENRRAAAPCLVEGIFAGSRKCWEGPATRLRAWCLCSVPRLPADVLVTCLVVTSEL